MNQKLLQSLPTHITCIGVSKHQSLDTIKKAYSFGIHDFGENKVQELLTKTESNQPWRWHFIGHLQTNKVRLLLPYVYMIHSVDSIKLCEVIEKEASRIQKTIPILLQLNLTHEISKYGLDESTMKYLIQNQDQYPHLQFKGIMVMGPTSNDEFHTKAVFDQAFKIHQDNIKNSPHMNILSMGMSDDYHWAIERGATHIRLGRALFEE
jgi:pyridoxal phosphate enzyme (YggS family)